MVLPDTLSRAHPEFSDAGSDKHGLFDCVNALVFMPLTDKRIEELRTATAADDMMQQLTSVIKQGWPESKEQLPKQLIPYFDVRDTLTIQDGIVLKGERLVIPPSMRHDIKQRLHASHLGKDSMLRRAREVIYWPGLTHDVQQLAESCDICQSLSPRQRKETLTPHPRSDTPWQKIGLDLFSIHGRDYLVSVDYLSNFWEVDYLPTTSTSMILTKLKTHLARYGIPQVIISDNAQFVSEEFQTFTDEYGIEHLTSSPGHSQSNGKAESAVKAAKRLIKKCVKEKSDMHLALLELRNTPMQGMECSPAQLMFQRQTRSTLPVQAELLKPKVTKPKHSIEQRVLRQKKSYDSHATDLKPIPEGSPVIFDKFDPLHRKPIWKNGVVKEHHSTPRSYIIEADNGTQFRRNRIHIKPLNKKSSQQDPMPLDNSKSNAPELAPPAKPNPVPTVASPVKPSNIPRPKRATRQPSYLKDYVMK